MWKCSILGNLERSECSEHYKIKEQRLTGSTVKMLCPRIPWTQIMGHVGYFWIRDHFKVARKGLARDEMKCGLYWHTFRLELRVLMLPVNCHGTPGREQIVLLWAVTFQMRCSSTEVPCGGVVFVDFCKERKTADFGTGSIGSMLTSCAQSLLEPD